MGGIKARAPWVILLLALVLTGTGITLFLVNQGKNSVTATGNAFTTALVEQDTAASYDMLAGSFKKQLSENDWAAWVQFAFKDYDGKTPELIRQEPLENVGNVYKTEQSPTRLTYELTFDNQTYTFGIVLIKENDTWKISETGHFEQ